MKLHYSKLLLFSLLLNILAHNKNKPYLKTHHTSTTTSRVLSECDIHMPNYDKDPDMKSVKENFDRQTSQRFEEYEERMREKRQKCKEQCDKDIQQIILKDKIEKSLEEKVEKGCLRCGCGLGGVATSVGIIGPVAVKGLENAALLAAAQKGIATGIDKAIEGLKIKFDLEKLSGVSLNTILNAKNFKHPMILGQLVQREYNAICESDPSNSVNALCIYRRSLNSETYKLIATDAQTVALDAGKAAAEAEEAEIILANAESSYLYGAIGYSVLVILIILLVMIIIYLILRYRRKKKMNKKEQYTKLLSK
ncbi:hypothetical protein PFUGPA_00658 [Plasmodium falciparum Palo Alto/Uganda]|uniref:Rifin n=1 Tax=Plasmodium falciparum (isolate Palo Alto / Uganda) TaxID=57270 RepID=W4J6S9_PLAFP|nr:hypothetical protein PFUGPA_00658 [Plasmodium falciparum Palo Alto/Uganda]